MEKLSLKETKKYVLADVLSRPNAMNGLYKKLKLPLEWENLNTKDAIYIAHMADLADNAIQEAVKNGKNLNDREVQREVQAAFYGGATGALFAINYDKFLRFLGIRK